MFKNGKYHGKGKRVFNNKYWINFNVLEGILFDMNGEIEYEGEF